MLPVSLDCPFLIALRYSLTFIYMVLYCFVFEKWPVSMWDLTVTDPHLTTTLYKYNIVLSIRIHFKKVLS